MVAPLSPKGGVLENEQFANSTLYGVKVLFQSRLINKEINQNI